MTLRIGPLRLATPVVLAPMAGVTDRAYRQVCAEHGEALYVAEMVTARGLVEGNDKSWRMVAPAHDGRTRSLQLYGADPGAIGEAVARLVAAGYVDHLDLNMGCPVAKVTRHGGGAALPVRHRLFTAVVAAAVRAAGGIPVTVKLRLGLDDARLTYLEAASAAVAHGAAAVTLHARTAVQGYGGTARWEAIATLKRHLPEATVLGNGDVWTAADAQRMRETTGCDGVVVGRGCLGRPWLFGDLTRVFAGERPLGPPTLGVLSDTIRQHLTLLTAEQAPTDAVRRFRKHLRWYLQGYPVGRRVHAAAGTITSAADVDTLLAGLDPTLQVTPSAVAAPRGRTGSVGRLVLPEGWWEQREQDASVPEDVTAVSGG